jgi:hypothetical protein
MFQKILRRLGYLKVDYGFSCGRHYIIIDGKTIAQTTGDDVQMFDEDVCTLGRAVIPGCTEHWGKPFRGDRSSVYSKLDPWDNT